MKVEKGKKTEPDRTLIYGPPGVGKSTWACKQGSLALDYERGLSQIGPDRVDGARDWESTLSLVREAMGSTYKSVVLDTIDALEDQATRHICAKGKRDSLSDFGFGAGYELLCSAWLEFLRILEQGREKGVEVVLVAHVQQKSVSDPTTGTYEKLVPQLQKRTWNITHRWCDNILFADYERGLVDGRAVLTGNRRLHVVASTGFDAKNRYGLSAPLPLDRSSWEAEKTADLLGGIEALVTKFPDTREKVAAALAEAKGSHEKVRAILTALKEKAS